LSDDLFHPRLHALVMLRSHAMPACAMVVRPFILQTAG
jgi:hypothetical protein